MSSKKVNFLDTVEKELRKLAPSKGLRVWRGRRSGFLHPKKIEFDVVVLYLGSDAFDDPCPELLAMAVAFDGLTLQIEAEGFKWFVALSTPLCERSRLLRYAQDAFSDLPSFTDE